MEIEYRLQRSDLVAFTEYHVDHSEALRSTRQRQRFVFPLLFLALGAVLAVVRGSALDGVPLWVGALAWTLLLPTYLKWRYRRHILRVAAPPGEEESLRRLVTSEGGLCVVSADGDSALGWVDVDHVERTDEHVFLYLRTGTALIVPCRDLPRELRDKFLEELARGIERTR